MRPNWGGTLFDRFGYGDLSTQHTRGEAEVAIQPTAAGLRERVFNIIATFGPLTDEEIAERGDMNPSTARPRRLELERSGRIQQAGYATTHSGRKAITWEIS